MGSVKEHEKERLSSPEPEYSRLLGYSKLDPMDILAEGFEEIGVWELMGAHWRPGYARLVLASRFNDLLPCHLR
ncbi:MAG TPA: hypothetical protein VK358_04545, partial [Longimicrobium sp.]|nr:hypothetical protein [Longimicrobium sp.]